MSDAERVDILNVGFDDLDLRGAVKRALELIRAHSGGWVVTPNPEIVLECRKNPQLAEAVREAALVIPDGIGVLYAARILGLPLREKIPGIDFACAVMEELAKTEGGVYLFGAKPGVAEAAAKMLLETYPGLRVCGTHDGYFSDDAPIAADIREKRPDFVLVCLGAPKQELWMRDHAAELDAGLLIGLGGSLDVFAGTVQRAPEGWRRLGLEWLYRLLKEPKRIRRMIRLPLILLLALRERAFGSASVRRKSDASGK